MGGCIERSIALLFVYKSTTKTYNVQVPLNERRYTCLLVQLIGESQLTRGHKEMVDYICFDATIEVHSRGQLALEWNIPSRWLIFTRKSVLKQ